MQNLPAFPVALEQTFRRQKNMMQVWPIFWSYLDRLIQRYSSLNYRYTARDQIRGLRILWTFC